ncbi:MAG: sulfotransferase [Gammaproteobacteria bacterium]
MLTNKYPDGKCIIILSEKSSGSSACQHLLSKIANINHIVSTRHNENETLYWTKAASVLNMPQLNMVDSEVPIEGAKARIEMISMLKDNVQGFTAPEEDEQLIFDGWRSLCYAYSPIFLEKSPHHLCQWSAIKLIVDAINILGDIEFLLIGLVRNPMDTVYSQFMRWKARPEQTEKQWLIAYQNLQKLKTLIGDQLVIVRYEDMVSSLEFLKPVFNFCGVTIDDADSKYLHKQSIQKWRSDKTFGFALSSDVISLAGEYGYCHSELANKASWLWPATREVSRACFMIKKSLKNILNT